MIKRILLALDGSDFSKPVTDYGLWLAGKFDATLSGLHVVDIVSLEGSFLHDISGALGFEMFQDFSSKMKEVLEERGHVVLEEFKEVCSAAGVECDSLLTSGIVANEISDKGTIKDLVIIGKRGINEEFEHGLLGSATEGVIRKSTSPVLIVPKSFTPVKNPLLCFDSSPNAAKAMHSAAEFSKTLKVPLTVISVAKGDDAERNLKKAEDYLAPYDIKACFVAVDDDVPSPVIKKHCEENSHDLVFMGATHHARLVAMVLGSTAEDIVRNVPCPIFLER